MVPLCLDREPQGYRGCESKEDRGVVDEREGDMEGGKEGGCLGLRALRVERGKKVEGG
jgi:hypothetical protein